MSQNDVAFNQGITPRELQVDLKVGTVLMDFEMA
jgi:hypothetical protein